LRHHTAGYFIDLNIDLSRLEKSLVDNLEQRFNGIFSTKRISHKELWISGDNPFSLRLNSKKSYAERWEKISSKEKKGFLRTKQIPVLREIPTIQINGMVYFEKLGGIDPNPILDVLIDNGYYSKIISTSQELEKAVEKAKEARNNFSYQDHLNDRSIDEGLSAFYLLW